MKEALLILCPFLAALALWMLHALDRFVLLLVLPAMVYPRAVLNPGGTQIAIADILMVVAVGGWLVNNSLRVAPDPFVKGNRMLMPMVVFVGISLISVAWSGSPHETLVFVVQLVGIVLVTPLIFASVPR